MKITSDILSQVLYTATHEWILFDGTLAYVGLTLPKLAALKHVETIDFDRITRIFKRGETIATVKSELADLRVFMPVEGIILDHNLQLNASDLISKDALHLPWMFFMTATEPSQKSELLDFANYQKRTVHDI